MAYIVSITQAVANAMATYLSAALTGGVIVQPRWPDANTRLPPRAVTVLLVGPPIYDMVQARPDTTTIVDATHVSTSWVVYNVRQPMQLDVWATSDASRDDIIAQLDNVMNVGQSALVNPISLPDPTGEGTTLNIGNGWNGTADYIFDSPGRLDTADSVQRSEYRASAKGEAHMALSITAVSSRMNQIIFKEKVHEALTAPTTQLFDIVTITASGVTRTQGT